MKVIKVDSSNDQGADFKTINLEEVLEELKAKMLKKNETVFIDIQNPLVFFLAFAFAALLTMITNKKFL